MPIHRATDRFWEAYNSLPEKIRASADRSYAILRQNPKHPSLRFKKVGEFWSARVGIHHRALAVSDGDGFIWVWVGTHDEYDRLLGR